MGRKEEIAKLKEILLRRRDEIRRQLAGEIDALQGGGEQLKGDLLDAALDASYGELNSQLIEVESRELAQIERALQRMEEGTYGICEVTGKPIPLARLQALPYATTTIEAQRELEKRGRGAPGQRIDWGRVVDPPDFDGDPMLPDVGVDAY